MTKKQMRASIVNTVGAFCKMNNLDYRKTWRTIYEAYGNKYHIWPSIWYKGYHNKDKLSFLEDYEDLYKTLTKMYNLVKELEDGI